MLSRPRRSDRFPVVAVLTETRIIWPKNFGELTTQRRTGEMEEPDRTATRNRSNAKKRASQAIKELKFVLYAARRARTEKTTLADQQTQQLARPAPGSLWGWITTNAAHVTKAQSTGSSWRPSTLPQFRSLTGHVAR